MGVAMETPVYKYLLCACSVAVATLAVSKFFMLLAFCCVAIATAVKNWQENKLLGGEGMAVEEEEDIYTEAHMAQVSINIYVPTLPGPSIL